MAMDLKKLPNIYPDSQIAMAVATPDEGIRLRKIIPHRPIQVLSCLRPHEIDAVIESNCIPMLPMWMLHRNLTGWGKNGNANQNQY